MRERTRHVQWLLAAAGALAVAVLLAPAAARAAVPSLMQRAVLPYTPALPTSACVVSLKDGEQLVVGLADGEVVVFHRTAGGVFDRSVTLPGSGPVGALVACRTRRSGGGSKSVILAVRGRDLFSVSFDDMRVTDRMPLPAPTGRYRLAKASYGTGAGAQRSATGLRNAGAEHAVLYDDDSAAQVTIEAHSLGLSLDWQVDGEPALAVTQLSDRVVAVTRARATEFVADAVGVRPPIDERTDLAEEPRRVVLGPAGGRPDRLVLRVSDPDSVWVGRTVALGESVAVVVPVSDTVMAAGGATALTPTHDVGWVALVGADGRVLASTKHASPVTNVIRVGDFIAVQGGDRNLSVYDLDLDLLWDHDSPVEDVVLLAGDFAGDGSEDLAVVGTRTYEVGLAMADSIRFLLDAPGFMAGAETVGGSAVLRRAFITFYVSNAGLLEDTLAEGAKGADDAFAAGAVDSALTLAVEARAAAAALGRRDDVAGLTSRISEYVSYPRRRRSMLLSALVLALLGGWVAWDCFRGRVGAGVSAAAALLLLAAGGGVGALLGRAGLNPLLFVGGVVAMLGAAQAGLRPGAVRRRVPGAAVEELIRVLMEFLHGAGEGVPSDGVVDAARKSVTKVAYLAQEMSDSLSDRGRYERLRERFRSRGEDFLNTTYPRVALLLSLAHRTGFITAEAEQMSRAAERMRTAIVTVLREPPADASVLKEQLEALREARDSLAAAADRAWTVVQSNPGCSLRQSVERILREKQEDLDAAGVRVELAPGVPPERDAVALWSFQFRYILENLTTNAIRAMQESGGGRITIETATDGAVCTVRFTDTGCGMTQERAAAVFRAKPEERGGGSGLPGSRALVQERGGDLRVERTAPGEGTTFVMTIPHWTPHGGGADV